MNSVLAGYEELLRPRFVLSASASGIYIDAWKKARVTPIFKSENRQKCENYRPISILPIISKIFEKEVFGNEAFWGSTHLLFEGLETKRDLLISECSNE